MKKVLPLFFIFSCILNAQNDISQIIKTPIAPNIASIGEYGYYPIGYYTGTPVIEFPFYDINLDGKIITIKLKYNASGIRVEQESSNVGLGWVMETGGHITKEVRGFNDFINLDYRGLYPNIFTGYYYNYNRYESFVNQYSFDQKTGFIDKKEQPNSENEKLLFESDLEPDLYHFNFCGINGTCYFQPRENASLEKTIIKPIIESSNVYIDLSYDIDKHIWIIFDQEGYKYLFEEKEYTETYTESTPYKNSHFLEKKNISKKKVSPYTETSWQLSSIESPKGKKITFEYEFEFVSSPVNYTFNNSYPIPIEGLGGVSIVCGNESYHCYSYYVIKQSIIKKISFTEGSVSFHSSSRKDMDCFVSRDSEHLVSQQVIKDYPPQKLNKVIIKDNFNNTIKDISLLYRYMGDTLDYTK
ncbi:hypothetical protein JGH11_19975, partial [Dysgonomonas sp. Marseille-P4677]|uniref:hypothetical protein n=1 Tax=Dysgonomonas sp. Marseille-P4677 TaxID=2364790 RepID=UPI001913513F